MDVETKLELIKRPPTEEIITEEDLKNLLQTNEHPRHYIGFEISGFLHLGTLMVAGGKINDLVKAGIDCTVYLADWHSYINNKLGGNWDHILKAAQYYKEAFQLFCPGAKVVLGSDLYHNNNEYWKDVIRFSKEITLARNTRCLTIMGRSENESLDFAQFIYPPMQGVDVKYLGPDLPHGGMDQRKIHVLCREVYPKLKWKKPVLIHNHLLMGLSEPVKSASSDKLDQVIASKMSKSKPWTAVFIHDTEQEIKDKLKKAWCPEGSVEMNPVLELIRYVVLNHQKSVRIERPQKYGGPEEFDTYDELEKAFLAGEIHPQDLKNSVAIQLNKIIAPIREHFEKPANAKLLEVYKDVKITR